MRSPKEIKRSIIKNYSEMDSEDKFWIWLGSVAIIGTATGYFVWFKVGKIRGAVDFVNWIANNAPEADAVLRKINPDILKILRIK